MILFVSSIAVVLTISFLCSVCESVLLTTTTAQAQALARTHRRGGQWLAGFKRDIDRPIAAILILNTASHTVGAAVGGDMVAIGSRLRTRAVDGIQGLADLRAFGAEGRQQEAIARETEKSVSSALGPKTFQTYQKTGSRWISGLTLFEREPPPPPPPPVPPNFENEVVP